MKSSKSASWVDYSIDVIIDKLLNHPKEMVARPAVSQQELKWLCHQAKSIFKSQPVFLELMPPLTICGDVHGQFTDLLKIFEGLRSPEVTNYLFLGDYVDRGPSSLNTIALLFAYKIKYPQNFFMLRGNHETADTNEVYGFYDEISRVFPGSNLWLKFNECFDWLPISALIDGRIFCVHGGISPDLETLDQLKSIERPNDGNNKFVEDLLWSDPNRNVGYWKESDREIGFLFGWKPLAKFLEENDLDIVVRAHEAVDNGYQFPYFPQKNAVTVFSAPAYCGEYDNKGAMMHVDEMLSISFTTIESENQMKQVPKKKNKKWWSFLK